MVQARWAGIPPESRCLVCNVCSPGVLTSRLDLSVILRGTVLLGLYIKEVASDPSHQPARPVPLSQKKTMEINLT